MTTPEKPPPSSSPVTTRESTPIAGGLDPYPPNPGFRACRLAPHVVLIIELALLAALSRGSAMLLALPALLVLSAWAAWLLARVDVRHRPIAVGVGVWAALALLGRGVDVTMLAGAGPYTGWARAAFHIEEATRLVTAALPAWMALTVMTKYPLGPSLRQHLAWWLPWACALVLLVIGYPELRGDALRRAYLGAELAALLVAVVAILSWVQRRGWRAGLADPSAAARAGWTALLGPVPVLDIAADTWSSLWYTYGTVLAIVVGDVVLLGVGAWRYGLFGDAYVVQQGGLLGVWGIVALLQGTALVMARRGA